jgi:hypothetical protein
MVTVVYRPQSDQDLGYWRVKMGGIPMRPCCDLTSKPSSTLRDLRTNRESAAITDNRVIVTQEGCLKSDSWTDS